MNAGKVIKFIFYFTVVVLVLMCFKVAHDKYFGRDDGQSNSTVREYRLEFKEISVPKSDEKSGGACQFAYDFKNMLALIEACEKVKYMDYLRFSRPQEASAKDAAGISQETLQSLVKAIHDEKSKLKKHIADLKSCSKDSVPSKRIKALKYYLRVMELNLQDLKGIAASKKE